MSDKMPLSWHKESLNNQLIYLERERAHVEAMVASLARTEKGIRRHVQQIERAEREGKDGFDSEKFLTDGELAERKANRRRQNARSATCRETSILTE